MTREQMSPITFACDNSSAKSVEILMKHDNLEIPDDLNWDEISVARALLRSEKFQPTLERAVRSTRESTLLTSVERDH